MSEQPVTLHDWPQAILHVDADAFFASCEQAIHPELKGRPVITGKERGIIAAASYEAKAKGVGRGMRLSEAKRVCPDLVVLPSDYETYSLYSVRMFAILRRFSPQVEEYSIDEAFVDLTGMRRYFHASYGQIAATIKDTVAKELGITVSVGVSVSKVLAKIASKHRKPNGLTVIPGREIHRYLAELPLGKVWGIGPNTATFLAKFDLVTALQFARCKESFVKQRLSKPYLEVWQELNGQSVLPLTTEDKSQYQSISKMKTFTPPSTEEAFVFAQLSKNLESACIKARRHHLSARKLMLHLRTQEFRDVGIQLKLNRPSCYPADMMPLLRVGFSNLYSPGVPYRATGVVLSELLSTQNLQHSLFEEPVQVEKMERLYEAVDALADRFGKHTLQHASSLPARLHAQHQGERGELAQRKTTLFRGENNRQRLGVPVLRIEV